MTPQRALLPAPPGSLPYTVELSIGDAVPFILKDGSRRTVTLKQTRLVFAHGEITVWATATVEVSGPGLEPQTAEIHAAYFNEPVVLNDVRVYVAQTKEFNPALRGSEVVDKDARLLLSDARYTMTDVSSYRWPFPSLLWQEGSHTTYWLGLQTTPGTPRTISHHLDGIDIGMPKNTRIHAWHEGTLAVRNRGFDRIVWLDGAADRQSGTTDHRLLHLDTVEPNAAGTRVKPGDFIGLSGRANWWHTHIVGGFRWGPMLAEWYTAHASPVERSYIKDWLIAGPFYNPSPVTRLDQDYVGGEAAATPAPGAPAGAEGKVWRTWDNVVPGVVLVGEAVDLFPFSGWAWVNGNHVNGVAYLATYIRSTQPRNVVLNIGASDSVKVWLGERLLFTSESCVLSGLEEEGPTIIVDQHKVPVSLTAGWNRLLVKVAQRDGCPQSWQLSVRVSDEAGAPIPDLAISPLMDPSRKVDTMLVGAVAAAVATPVLTPTPTPSPRPTPVPSPTPVPPAGFTPLPPTPTSTPVPPPTPSPAPLPTATPIPTATPPPTPTPVPTATPVPPTATPIPVPTATPVPPATSTPVPTATPVPPTATPLLLPTATTAPVPTATATPPPTPTPPVTITIGPFSISLTLDLSATDSRRGDSDARAAIDKKSNRVQGGTGTAEYSHW